MKAFGFYVRISEAMSFLKFATFVSKVINWRTKISIVWHPLGKNIIIAGIKPSIQLRIFAVLQSVEGTQWNSSLPQSCLLIQKIANPWKWHCFLKNGFEESNKDSSKCTWSWCQLAPKGIFNAFIYSLKWSRNPQCIPQLAIVAVTFVFWATLTCSLVGNSKLVILLCAWQENWQCERFACSRQKGMNDKTPTI